MPAVRDVGAIHRARLPTYCTLGDVHKTVAASHAREAFRLIHRGRGETHGLGWSAGLPYRDPANSLCFLPNCQ